MASTYELVRDFRRRYPATICWRIKQHCKKIDKNLNKDERVNFAFAAQYNASHGSIFDTGVLALTNERLIIAQDRIIIGYRFSTITPDLYNDLQISAGIFFGMITIDTIKETVTFSNLSKRALPEIQKNITSFMIEAKKKYKTKEDEEKDSK